MTEETHKVGDVVAWEQVPVGALVRVVFNTWPGLIAGHSWYALRLADCGAWVGAPRDWHRFCSTWPWSEGQTTLPVTIIALGLTGQETADDLRRMAEVFEVRETLTADLALLQSVVEVKTLRHLWTPDDAIEFVPAVCSRMFGNGKALLALTTINQRPRFYVLRIDSTWSDIHEHIDSICDALLDEFGPVRDDEGDGEERDWPAFDDDCGTSWGWVTDEYAERLHAAGWRPGDSAEKAAELLREADP